MAVVKVKELIGISNKSFEDALKEAIRVVIKQKKNVTGAKILGQSVVIKNGKIAEYRVNANIAYLWEEKYHKK